ncbi:MAG: lipid-A-disaccharide synthase [Calditrichaeota bacterium]|nr:lipid-A-disaccharide synthase [Calditrichota bacterium]
MSVNERKEILIVTGENSGDIHAAPVVKELKRLHSDLHFFGSGGEALKQEGVELLADVRDLAVMGFSEVPRLLPRLRKLKRAILQRVRSSLVPLAILVDYPGFNLNLAPALKALPHPPQILYYIAPQVWAWRAGRIQKMRDFIDRLAVVLPFEELIFSRAGIRTQFVGHPLLDELNEIQAAPKSNSALAGLTIALLPGSREAVVKRHLRLMLASAEQIHHQCSSLKAIVARAPGLDLRLFQHSARASDWISVNPDSRTALRLSDVAAVCSGTATLEAALMNIPQVVVYRTSLVNFLIARYAVSLPNISLVNVIAGRKVAPELIQDDFTTGNLTNLLIEMLENEPRRREIQHSYDEVRQLLGAPGAAAKTAAMASEMLKL